MRRAIFLDRDNTLIFNDGYLGDPAGVRLLPYAAVALRQLSNQGYLLIVVSNQAGVAHGMFSEDDVDRVNTEVSRQLMVRGDVTIDKYYSCFYHDNPKTKDPVLWGKWQHPNHPLRKPNPGMLIHAAKEFNLDLSQCWMIGDSLKDVEAGQAAGCRTLLLLDPSIVASPDANKGSENTKPNFTAHSWGEIPIILEREGPLVPTL